MLTNSGNIVYFILNIKDKMAVCNYNYIRKNEFTK